EAVNCIDLEAAFGLERLGKQPASRLYLVLIRLAIEKRTQPLRQRLGGLRGPERELVEQPVLHLRRRHLGVGEAEDALWLRASQQQAQRAPDQDLRLAGASIGRDPGRRGRIGCTRLIGISGMGRGVAHQISSSRASVCHSARRARWAWWS